MVKVLETIKFEVTDEWLNTCNAYQRRYSGISLTPEQMLEVFKTNEQCLIQSLSMAFETGEREWFMSMLSEHLIGLDWPCNMDAGKRKYNGFYEKLMEAAEKAGYDIL